MYFHSMDFNLKEVIQYKRNQSSNLLLAFSNTVILNFWPRRDP
jgi:hypothetical protein